MTTSFPETPNSRLFKFIVGESIDGIPAEFSVHEEAVARLSKPLHSLLRGDLCGSADRLYDMGESQQGNFGRFVQFAYTGDYSIPQSSLRKKLAYSGAGSPFDE
ncbi:hypothetical protein BKA65DRAFT_514704 [Rhexocercosporidium sp. MPI-PUGE-AT-0058]|nr:hypothetical protein BKA65DRAFT_514704 [Rhexocercosporidium sp. MPI-PUGE-AT-0058]